MSKRVSSGRIFHQHRGYAWVFEVLSHHSMLLLLLVMHLMLGCMMHGMMMMGLVNPCRLLRLLGVHRSKKSNVVVAVIHVWTMVRRHLLVMVLLSRMLGYPTHCKTDTKTIISIVVFFLDANARNNLQVASKNHTETVTTNGLFDTR
jgi:hypothetical protein